MPRPANEFITGVAMGFMQVCGGATEMDRAMFSTGFVAGVRFVMEHPEYASAWHKDWMVYMREPHPLLPGSDAIPMLDDGLSQWIEELVQQMPIDTYQEKETTDVDEPGR